MSRLRIGRRWLIAGIVVVVAAVAAIVSLVVTAGGGSGSTGKGPRPVTAVEAQRLATMRVKNFEAVGSAFHATLVTAQAVLTLNGDVDFHTVTGYAEVSGGGDRSYTLEWNAADLLAWESRGKPTMPPKSLPTAVPRERALSPSSSGVDTLLALVLGLGRSQPDDAKQVQKGSRWIGTATVDGRTVDVMQGPTSTGANTSLDFWVDRSGQLLRVTISLAGANAPSIIDLNTSGYQPFETSHFLNANGTSSG